MKSATEAKQIAKQLRASDIEPTKEKVKATINRAIVNREMQARVCIPRYTTTEIVDWLKNHGYRVNASVHPPKGIETQLDIYW